MKKTPKINKKGLKKPSNKVKTPKTDKEPRQNVKVENKATAAPNSTPAAAKKVSKPPQTKRLPKTIKIIKLYF